jgi:hypothetical protein
MQNISNRLVKMSASESNEEEAEGARLSPFTFFPLQAANTAFKRKRVARPSEIITCSPGIKLAEKESMCHAYS